MSDRSSVRWSFVRHYDDGETTWLWQRFVPDGRVEKTSAGIPPALDGFRKGYNELLVLKLATRTAERMEITERGEEALRARHLRN